MSSKFETGFFVKREAWHRQGVVLEDYPDIKTAYRESGLNWVVDKRQLVLPAENGFEEKSTEAFAIVRQKDNKILGYSGMRYEVFQNAQAFAWMEPLVSSGLWNIETAGSLKGGEVCWALMRQGEIEIVPNDVLKEYLLFTWSHNGNLTNIIQPTMIRVVCNNTLQASLAGRGYTKVVHTKTIKDKMQFVQTLFTQTNDAFQTQTEMFKRMLDKTVTTSLMNEVIEEFYGMQEGVKETPMSIGFAKKRLERVKFHVYENASGRDLGVQNTAYGLFQALSEFNEHYFLPKRTDAGWNILFGKGADLNKKILSRLAS